MSDRSIVVVVGDECVVQERLFSYQIVQLWRVRVSAATLTSSLPGIRLRRSASSAMESCTRIGAVTRVLRYSFRRRLASRRPARPTGADGRCRPNRHHQQTPPWSGRAPLTSSTCCQTARVSQLAITRCDTAAKWLTTRHNWFSLPLDNNPRLAGSPVSAAVRWRSRPPRRAAPTNFATHRACWRSR